MQTLAERATIWFDQDTPIRLFWRNRRWSVTDTPTPLYATRDDVPNVITHAPPAIQVGWRFQATTDDDTSLLVDVVQYDGEWIVARTYE